MVSYYICFAFSSCKSTFYETVQFHVTVIANSFILKYSVEMLNTSSDWKSKILFWFIFSVRSDILKYMVNNSKKTFCKYFAKSDLFIRRCSPYLSHFVPLLSFSSFLKMEKPLRWKFYFRHLRWGAIFIDLKFLLPLFEALCPVYWVAIYSERIPDRTTLSNKTKMWKNRKIKKCTNIF